MTTPFAIAGAGLLGASLAYHMSSQGRDVIIIDDERTGRATGWNPGGINPLHGPGCPGIMSAAYQQAYELHCAQHCTIRELSGIDFGWKVIQRLFVASDEAEAEALRNIAGLYQEMAGFSANWMEQSQMVRWDGRVGPSWIGGLMTEGNVRIDAERYRLALLAAASRSGARVITGSVGRVKTSGDCINAVDFGAGDVAVSGLCMATGSWAMQHIPGWAPGISLAISPLIGDLLLVKASGVPLPADISHGLTAIYQHDGEHYWIGGTARATGLLGEGTAEAKRQLLVGARRLMPCWNSFRIVAQSSAARPTTKDGLPVLGRAPAYSNGWVLNGAGGKGVLLCNWMANAMAQMIQTGDTPPELLALSPSRLESGPWKPSSSSSVMIAGTSPPPVLRPPVSHVADCST